MTIIDKLRRHNPTIVVELFSKRTKDSLSNSIGLQEVSINDIDKFYIGGSMQRLLIVQLKNGTPIIGNP